MTGEFEHRQVVDLVTEHHDVGGIDGQVSAQPAQPGALVGASRAELDRLGAHVADDQIGADDGRDDVEQFDRGMVVMEGQQLDGLGGAVVAAQHVVDGVSTMVHRHALGEPDLLGEAPVRGQGEPEARVVSPQPPDGGHGQVTGEADGEQRLAVGQRADHRSVGHHPVPHRGADG